ncbi:MAG: phosphate ABC transporter permease PstA [Anaerolineae bacterium]|nr:phosphate ABC transporter permease PstA [Anaerolineae bacterium]
MPNETDFRKHLAQRNGRGRLWQSLFFSAIMLGLLMLVILLFSIINQTFGYVAVKQAIPPEQLANRPLEELAAPDLAIILQNNLTKGRMQAVLLENILGTDVDRSRLADTPIQQLVPANIDTSVLVGDKLFAELSVDEIAALLASNLSTEQLLDDVYEKVVGIEYLQSWPLITSLFNRAAIEQEVAERAEGIGLSPTLSTSQRDEVMADYAASELQFFSWLNRNLVTRATSEIPSEAGIRQGLIGSVMILVIAMAFSAPVGVGAALYLEEYAKDSKLGQNAVVRWFNQFIETNIRNLAGVPSIIYGLLGLAIFARLLEPITSGQLFLGDAGGPNGRTILSAGLTLGVLILPVIIINAQEAIRAVPSSIREASYGLGATKWQTVSRQVIPAAVPGIMTGIILSLSRAIGETAPLIVIGAAVFLSKDPNSPFASFTTLPITIYNWASQPQAQFQNAASAAIIVLLLLLLTLNATAIIVRQRFSRRLQ